MTADKLQELYASLAKKSSEIYIQRSQKLYEQTPMRKRLFTWAMEDLEILAFSDLSFHGKENVVKHMQEIDKDRYQKAVFFHTPVEEKCISSTCTYLIQDDNATKVLCMDFYFTVILHFSM